MQRKHWKRAIAVTLTSLATASLGTPMLLAQTGETTLSVPTALQSLTSAAAGPIQYLPFAHFNIPFQVDPSGPVPREVHLWVSPDQGRSWLKYASTTPDKRSFEFHAAAEGEYLFAVQTHDGQGESALAASPPMHIMIDTTQPQVQLSVDVSPAGRLVIDYQISDAYLAEDSVRLAYSADGRGQWEEVRIGNLDKSGASWSGRCELEMPHCHELDVRVTANDTAQNKAEKVFHFSAPRTAAAASGMQLASQRGDPRSYDPHAWVPAAPPRPVHSAQRLPQAGGVKQIAPMLPSPGAAPPVPQLGLLTSRKPTAAAAGAWQPGAGLVASQGAVAWDPGAAPGLPTSLPQSLPTGSGATAGPAAVAAPGRTIALQPNMPQPSAADRGPRLAAVPPLGYEELPPPAALDDSRPDTAVRRELQLSNSATAGAVASERPVDRPLPVARREVTGIDLGRADQAPPAVSAAPSLNIQGPLDAQAPLDTQSPLGGSAGSAAGGSAASAAQAAGEGVSVAEGIGSGPAASIDDAYHSRSRTFSLDYAVDSLRGAAVADIELWGTEDRGSTWQKWGSDPDRQSPFDVQVGNDGLFGFRMVVIGANGLISNRPDTGDSADMWINVDTQMPTVNITRALYGEGDQAGMLVIEFTGSDDNMHDRPVSLAYSERPAGPWVTIASGLASSGKYVWKPDSSLPRQVFLRAQAVDRAGNTQEHRLELPVSLRGLAPQGRIQGFRPIDSK